jgi:hypothetical protein
VRPWSALSRLAVAASFAAIVGVVGLDLTALIAPEPQAGSFGSGTGLTPATVPPTGDLQPRLLQWSGRTWMVYPNSQPGPEKVLLNDSPDAVYVDGQGRLHLNIIKIRRAWRSVELQSLTPVSYGTYQTILDTAVAKFSPEVVFGVFVYQPGTAQFTNEIDIEDAQFPHYLRPPENAQFVVQPYYSPNHSRSYQIRDDYVPLYQQFTWLPPHNGNGTVDFETRVGTTSASPLLAHWRYFGYSDPSAVDMYLYVVLWLDHGKAPTGGAHSAIVRSVTFTPLGE